jgi:hypothetical protein
MKEKYQIGKQVKDMNTVKGGSFPHNTGDAILKSCRTP